MSDMSEEEIDGDVISNIAREVISGISPDKSRYAPLSPEKQKVWDRYVKAVANAPEGVVIEIPWSMSEEPSDPAHYESWSAGFDKFLSEQRAKDAIKYAEKRKQ